MCVSFKSEIDLVNGLGPLKQKGVLLAPPIILTFPVTKMYSSP